MKTGLKRGRSVLLFLIDLYGMMVILILISQALIGERVGLVALFNTLAQILWFPSLFLLPLSLLLRSRRSSLMVLPGVICFVVTFGDHFVPKAPLSVMPDQTTFTLATFNLYDDGRDPSRLVDLIRTIDADVIAMQEVNAPTAVAFEAELADLYPYQALHGDEPLYRGMGTMSKYPIVADRYWNYAWMPVVLGHQRVELQLGDDLVALYNVHPIHPGMVGEGFDPSWRGKEIAAIFDETQAETLPVIVAGDFNMPELSEQYAKIVHDYGFVDAYRVRGWGMGHTFTYGFAPFLRLDYIFLKPRLDVAQIEVWPSSAGSDHRPVVAEIVLP